MVHTATTGAGTTLAGFVYLAGRTRRLVGCSSVGTSTAKRQVTTRGCPSRFAATGALWRSVHPATMQATCVCLCGRARHLAGSNSATTSWERERVTTLDCPCLFRLTARQWQLERPRTTPTAAIRATRGCTIGRARIGPAADMTLTVRPGLTTPVMQCRFPAMGWSWRLERTRTMGMGKILAMCECFKAAPQQR